MGTFKTFLQTELARRAKEHPGYSLRAFARSLQTDPSALSKILAGRLKVGPRTIRRLWHALALSSDEIDSFVALRSVSEAEKPSGASWNYRAINAETFKVVSDWYHYAILELTHVRG